MSQHKHKKRFGQHFLHDRSVLLQMQADIAPKQQDMMVEIGPGEGALTQYLIDRVARLTLVEIDNDLIPRLKHSFAHKPAFALVHQDALTLDYRTLIPTEAPNTQLRVVGNLPYNISTPLIFHLLQHRQHIQDMHFMLQKEVVERLASPPDGAHYGRLSVMAQYYCAIDDLLHIGPEAFDPPPKVDSAIVRLKPYITLPFAAKNEPSFAQLVKQAFSMRRKTLRNTLKPLLSSVAIEACDIDPSVRAETLAVGDFVRLADRWYAQESQHHA